MVIFGVPTFLALDMAEFHSVQGSGVGLHDFGKFRYAENEFETSFF